MVGFQVYPCELCKKTFSRNGDLTRHKAIHSGEKNHVCVTCGMRFAQHSGLKTHRNTHTGEKPHKCNYCGKTFGDPSSCARHEKEKHFGKPFQCRWCPSSIVRRSSFAGHLKEKHPEIRHLVTKEFLDELEGPRQLKPKNKRGRNRRSTTTRESRVVAKVEAGYSSYNRPHPPAIEDEIALPKLGDVKVGGNMVKTVAVEQKVEQEHTTRRNTEGLSLSFETPTYSTSFPEMLPMSQPPVPEYRASTVYQRQQLQHQQRQHQQQFRPQPQPQQQLLQQEHHPVLGTANLNFNYAGMYTGPSRYDDGNSGVFDARSVSSSPGPITPLDVKPPTHVEPSKINPYDFSLYGAEKQHGLQYVAPSLYPYAPEQQGLLYFGL